MSNTNHALRPQLMARGLNFLIKEEEGLLDLHVCSKNKGADQLRSILQRRVILMQQMKSKSHTCSLGKYHVSHFILFFLSTNEFCHINVSMMFKEALTKLYIGNSLLE